MSGGQGRYKEKAGRRGLLGQACNKITCAFNIGMDKVLKRTSPNLAGAMYNSRNILDQIFPAHRDYLDHLLSIAWIHYPPEDIWSGP